MGLIDKGRYDGMFVPVGFESKTFRVLILED